jgi:hypothetical protein
MRPAGRVVITTVKEANRQVQNIRKEVLMSDQITELTCTTLPNAEVEWLALLLRIREVPSSNLYLETGNSEIFRGFLQFLQTYAGKMP